MSLEKYFKQSGFHKVTLKFNLLLMHFKKYSTKEIKSKVEKLIEEVTNEHKKTGIKKELTRDTVIENMANISRHENNKEFLAYLHIEYPIQTDNIQIINN